MQGTAVAAENGILHPTEVLQPWGYEELPSSAHYAIDLDPIYSVKHG